jgi:hypothetical protein
MDEKNGLSVITAIFIFATLLTLFLGDRLIDRVMDGDEVSHTKVLIGVAFSFAVVAVLVGRSYLYSVGPVGVVRIFVALLVLVLVSAFFWDVATTFIGVHSIILPNSTQVKAVAGAALISATMFTVLLGVGEMFDGNKPVVWVRLYVPIFLCVLVFDFWTTYRGTAYFLWNVTDPTTLPHDQFVILMAIAVSVCLCSIILGTLLPRLLRSKA